jgi:hypothetical protein
LADSGLAGNHRAPRSAHRRLLDDPPRLERMREAARQLGRPNAARDIARITLEEPEKRPVIISNLRVKVLRKRIAEGA